jgi:galactokinase
MLDVLTAEFRTRFGRAPELAARAPGRVNLIGEHTDYSAGLVLPCAIDRETWVLGARRDDGRFRVFARELGESAEFDRRSLRRCGTWVDYVQGAVSEFGGGGPGLEILIGSALPREVGLSSSAALEVAVVTLLDAAAGGGLDGRARARVAHRAETGFVGLACGIMDQFASALGVRDHALRIDCRSLEVEAVPLSGVRLLVVDSGVRRKLTAGGYGDRRAECEAAAREVGALRDVGLGELRGLSGVALRRARHVVSENGRVERTCAALARGDLDEVGELLREGMRSLRDDFEVSTPELDFLCERGDAHPGVYGSRLTGAGFGGCTLHLVRPEAAREAADWIAAGFHERFGRRPAVLEVRAWDGASVRALGPGG